MSFGLSGARQICAKNSSRFHLFWVFSCQPYCQPHGQILILRRRGVASAATSPYRPVCRRTRHNGGLNMNDRNVQLICRRTRHNGAAAACWACLVNGSLRQHGAVRQAFAPKSRCRTVAAVCAVSGCRPRSNALSTGLLRLLLPLHGWHAILPA